MPKPRDATAEAARRRTNRRMGTAKKPRPDPWENVSGVIPTAGVKRLPPSFFRKLNLALEPDGELTPELRRQVELAFHVFRVGYRPRKWALRHLAKEELSMMK